MPRYGEDEARRAVAVSLSYSETLRRLGMGVAGGNHALLRKYVDDIWRISTKHFTQDERRSNAFKKPAKPLIEILVTDSTYSRKSLKRRLFQEGIKQRRCEHCGQDETWRGRRMALILDHINGVPDDNRIENLRVLCPNCAATLDTHCGRKNRVTLEPRRCARCGKSFYPVSSGRRYCSQYCGTRWDRKGQKRLGARKAERPPLQALMLEVRESSWAAVGRKYGVSDNAIRKWVRDYQREALSDEDAA